MKTIPIATNAERYELAYKWYTEDYHEGHWWADAIIEDFLAWLDKDKCEIIKMSGK